MITRRMIILMITVALIIGITACNNEPVSDATILSDRSSDGISDAASAQEVTETIVFKIGEKKIDVSWENNDSVKALMGLVRERPLVIPMSRYGGFEQVGSIGASLPRNDVQTNTSAGDILLYSGNQIVVFYGANSWAYTRLGKVQNLSVSELEELLGRNDVTVTISLQDEKQPEKENPSEGILFTDIPAGSYFTEPVQWAVESGIARGTSETAFSPDDSCTRGQAVTFLWRAVGLDKSGDRKNPFKDINEGSFYYDAVLWAYNNGITSGINETEFGPNETCTRSQIVTFLWRMLDRPKAGAAAAFDDILENAYYYRPVLWAVSEGVTKGTSEKSFGPDNDCTRAQIVTFLFRALNKPGDSLTTIDKNWITGVKKK